jgi:hypothetical protein
MCRISIKASKTAGVYMQIFSWQTAAIKSKLNICNFFMVTFFENRDKCFEIHVFFVDRQIDR